MLDRLDTLAKDSPDDFKNFTSQFGMMIKEGAIVDPGHRERLAGLLRFASSRSEDSDPTCSLDDYIGRMAEDQKRIYYLGGPDLAAIRKSPNLEIFRRRGLEVLYLTEPIDEFVMNALGSHKDKPLTSIDSDDLELPETKKDEAKIESGEEPETKTAESGFQRVLELFRQAIGQRVREVRESKRLTDSPCCLVSAEGGFSTQMQRLMKLANKEFPDAARILEINPGSPLIRRLCRLSANTDHDAFIKQCGLQLWSNAMLLEGITPETEDLVARIQGFMDEAAEKRSPLILA